jgi:hypothetical protein
MKLDVLTMMYHITNTLSTRVQATLFGHRRRDNCPLRAWFLPFDRFGAES